MTRISADEIRRWRQDVWGDGQVTVAEANQLFDLNRQVGDDDPEWADFFVDALTDYLIRSGIPRGYVTDHDAEWLIKRISEDGEVRTSTELRLVDHLFERADYVPVSLKAFALDAMERAISSGTGPTRDGALDPGSINDAEVKLLRRFIFAPAGDGPAYVSRPEAELLWRLKDASLGRPNASGWKTLFVQALGNHLLAAPPGDLPNRETALNHEAFVNSPKGGLGNFLGRMATSRPDFIAAIGAIGERPGDYGGRLEASDDGLDAEERQWTEGKVVEDGTVDEFEQALLEFVVR